VSTPTSSADESVQQTSCLSPVSRWLSPTRSRCFAKASFRARLEPSRGASDGLVALRTIQALAGRRDSGAESPGLTRSN
jgi:hypothetical protein